MTRFMIGTLRTSHLAAAYYQLMERHLLPRLPAWRLTPDRLTWLGMLISVIVPIGFWIHPGAGFLLLLLSGIADSLDGLMARLQNRSSRWGAFLDSSLDRVSDFFYLLGFWVLLDRYSGQVPATLAIFASLLSTLLISYIKARAEALGGTCQVGLMERGVRTAYLIVWALLIAVWPSMRGTILWGGLMLYGVLTFFTVFQRWMHIAGQLSDRQPP
jgi:CDP-diacylglycerol--glycerol-3-phosphate 3-phosphatidyltransferase